MRIGHGYDVHRFGPGDAVVLGGVTIAHHRGLLAHSDGDVLIHAVCDALLGAIGHGVIGRDFADTESDTAGVDGGIPLRGVMERVGDRGWMLTIRYV
ncbi:MAG: 2-C-methyl-D-erythritol 2,4-cyclodiphosphate synthase, partial [Halieaceae bacterium]|nr:2-C-methyl-D-erythritol 2,4-cyclodiphosphate synthase [Halieaceae bacterium]